MPSALITGITGQDGSYLAELLLEKGYTVHGLVRRSSSFNTGRIDHILGRLKLHYGDLVDSSSLHAVLKALQPDEIYNLGSQSHVRVSFEVPEYTCDVAAAGVGRLRSRSGQGFQMALRCVPSSGVQLVEEPSDRSMDANARAGLRERPG